MPTALRALLAVSCLAGMNACVSVLTIDDIVTEEASFTDDRILGEWTSTDGDNRASITRGRSKDYSIIYWDKSDTAWFRVRIGRLGPNIVLDVLPDPVQWQETKQAGIATHSAFTLEFSGDSIGIGSINGDSLKKALATGRLRVPYTLVNGGDVLLHGDVNQVRATVTSLMQQRPMKDDILWFKRDIARTDSVVAAAKAERNAVIGFLRNMLVAQEVFFTDSNRYASKVPSLVTLKVPPTMTIRSLNGGGGFWNAIVTSSRLRNVECAIAVASANPLNHAAGEGEPVCR